MVFVDNVLQSGEYRWIVPLIMMMLALGLVTALAISPGPRSCCGSRSQLGQMVVTFLIIA